MKMIVAGGREFKHEGLLIRVLDERKGQITEVVSGTARGADQMGERWAERAGILVRRFPAEWDKFGKSAGYRRNEQMAAYADGLIAFWDGKSKGTGHMVDLARRLGKSVQIVKYSD